MPKKKLIIEAIQLSELGYILLALARTAMNSQIRFDLNWVLL